MSRLRSQRLQLPDSRRVGTTGSGRRADDVEDNPGRVASDGYCQIHRCRVPWAIDLIRWRTCRKPACAPVHSNSLAVSSVWEDYLQSLERCFRKELRRSWRVFTKMARLSGSSIHKMTRVGCSRRWKANNEPDSERTRHTCWTAQRLPRSIAQ